MEYTLTVGSQDELNHGQLLTFLAPTDSATFDGVVNINNNTGTEESFGHVYRICTSEGYDAGGVAGLWAKGTMITVCVNYTDHTLQLMNGASSVTVLQKLDELTQTLKRVSIPVQTQIPTCDPQAAVRVSPTWSGYDSTIMTISGTTSSALAGKHTVTFSLIDDTYSWEDGTKDDKQVTWEAARYVLQKPTLDVDSFEFDGTSKSFSLTFPNPDDEQYCYANFQDNVYYDGEMTFQAIDAGSYSVYVSPIYAQNCQWDDGVAGGITCTCTITPMYVDGLSVNGTYTYNGKKQTVTVSGGALAKGYVTVSGDTEAIHAGEYTVQVQPASTNYCIRSHEGGQTLTWEILPYAVNTMTLSVNSVSLTVTQPTATVSVYSEDSLAQAGLTAGTLELSVLTVYKQEYITIEHVDNAQVKLTGKGDTADVGTGTIWFTLKNAQGYSDYTCYDQQMVGFSSFVPGATLEDTSWSTIKTVISCGLHQNYWSIGDTKSVVISGTVVEQSFDDVELDAFIIGFNHNSSNEGTYSIHFQLGKLDGQLVVLEGEDRWKQGTTAGFRMNLSCTSSGGWSSSYMRTNVLGAASSSATSPTSGSLLAALPYKLRQILTTSRKYTDNDGTGATSPTLTSTRDFLFLLCEYEIRGMCSRGATTEYQYCKQYDYYKAGNSAQAYSMKDDTPCAYWLREPSREGEYFVCMASSGTDPSQGFPHNSGCICPCFSINYTPHSTEAT